MAEHYSRIHIRVSSVKVWERFEGNNDFDLQDIISFLTFSGKEGRTSCVLDNWSWRELELEDKVKALAKVLDRDGIVIADTHDINVDPYNYCVYYLGGRVRKKAFNWSKMYYETNIEDIPGWLNYGKFYKVSDKEKKVLINCGFIFADEIFAEFAADLEMPDKVYLRETGFENRPQIIENASLNQKVHFVHSGDSYDDLRLEVMNDQGSLGYLPSDVSDKIAPLFISNMLSCKARIVDLIKLSERNKHAKSPIVAISIETGIAR